MPPFRRWPKPIDSLNKSAAQRPSAPAHRRSSRSFAARPRRSAFSPRHLPSHSDHALGFPSLLAEQPEFSGADRMRRLIELTERPQALVEAIRKRGDSPGVSITIGAEHNDPRLDEFTVVTAEYKAGTLTGVIGVIGPTRMPYDKVISLVTHTSRLLTDLLD